MIEGRDYTLFIDKSGSMGDTDGGTQSRWDSAAEGTLALARKIDQLDPDGMTVYTFANSFKRYENVKSDNVDQVFKENEPKGGTDTARVLADAAAEYKKRKQAGTLKPAGELWIVVTDGVSNDAKALEKVIIDLSQLLEKDEDLAILFLQIGKDKAATRELQVLDDGLVAKGAKFDIVDTTTAEDAEDMTFAELLTKAIDD